MSMNRRSFVKGAATAAASIAAPVIASAEEAAVEEIAPVATYTCDTVVVGGGIAGLAAGLQSAQEGMGTIVLEKQTALGGGGAAPRASSAWAPPCRRSRASTASPARSWPRR